MPSKPSARLPSGRPKISDEDLDAMLEKAKPFSIPASEAREQLVIHLKMCSAELRTSIAIWRRAEKKAQEDTKRADTVVRLAEQLEREVRGALSNTREMTFWGESWRSWSANVRRVGVPFPLTWLPGAGSDDGRMTRMDLRAIRRVRERADLFRRTFKTPGRPPDPSRRLLVSRSVLAWWMISREPVAANRRSVAEFAYLFESAVTGYEPADNERLLRDHIWPLFESDRDNIDEPSYTNRIIRALFWPTPLP